MTIDPRFGFWFSIVMTIVATLGVCGAYFTTLFGPHTSEMILAGLAILNAINSAINAILHAIPAKANSASEFPLGPKVVSVLAVLILGSLIFPTSAFAQTKLKPLTGDLGADLGITKPRPTPLITGNVEKDVQAIWQKIIDASNADLTYASAMAGSANSSASLIRKQCYDAILTLNQQVNGQIKDSSGVVIPKPDPHLFTDVESLAETIDNLSPSGRLFTQCAGMAQLTKTNVLTLINAIVTGAAGMAAMPIIPGL